MFPDTDKDLLYIPMVISSVQVHVQELVYELIGEISSSSEEGSEVDSGDELEKYLLADPLTLDSQMAHTKQTAQKHKTPGTSEGGLPVARRSPRCAPKPHSSTTGTSSRGKRPLSEGGSTRPT